MIVNNAHQLFRALSEPVRLRIAVLLTRGELCVCDLTCVLEAPQSTISRHMARLKTAGLIRDRREGRWVHYSLNDGPGSQAGIVLPSLSNLATQSEYKQDFQELDQYLASKKVRCENE
jgi:ArsR family transcriptional regulator